jgi:hypothetical protein
METHSEFQVQIELNERHQSPDGGLSLFLRRCTKKVLAFVGLIYEALELKRVALEFSGPYSILRGNTLILGQHPNSGRVPLFLAYYPLFSGGILLF